MELTQNVFPESFSDLKPEDTIVVKTLKNIELSGELFVTYGSPDIYAARPV